MLQSKKNFYVRTTKLDPPSLFFLFARASRDMLFIVRRQENRFQADGGANN